MSKNQNAFWNERSSLRLTRALTVMFSAAVVLCDLFGPQVVAFLCGLVRVNHGLAGGYVLLAVLYLGSVPAYLLLYDLYRLLGSLEQGKVFTPENVARLRRVSWYCAAAALLCLAGAVTWQMLLILTVAAGFMALIVRAVKNVFEQAVCMKDELDYTI